MDLLFLRSVRESIKHWYIPLIVGIIFVLVSLMAFVSPTTSLLTLATLFSLSFIFSGITEIIFSIENRRQLYNWVWFFAYGLITLLVGILLFLKPEISILSLSLYVGFLVLFRSFSAISFSLDIRRYGSRGWGGMLFFGVFGVICAFLLLWNPIFAGLSIVFVIAFNILFAGLYSIYFAFELRKLHKFARRVSPEIRERIMQLENEIWSELE